MALVERILEQPAKFALALCCSVLSLLSAEAAQAEDGASIGVSAGASPSELSSSVEGDIERDAATTTNPSDPSVRQTRGFEHGLRLGVALPFGRTDAGNQLRSGDLDGIVGIRVPVWLDMGYRLDAAWWLGLAAQLGLGTVGDDCEDDQECEWSDLRLAAQATYALSEGASTEPWIGLGLGWEWLRGSVTLTVPGESLGLDQDIAVRAKELLGGPQLFAQGGLRFDVGESLTIGPYLSASAGMYLTDSFDCPDGFSCPDDGSVEDKKLHAWLGIGVRGTHGP